MAGVPTAANFMPHVGTTVSLPDGQALTLVAVDQPGGAARDAAPHPPFSLLLRGSFRADRARRHASPRL